MNWQDLFFGKSEVEKRRALKDLSLRLPARPLLRFVYMYFILGGCLDGHAGLAWCTLQAFYEYLILLKVWEMKYLPKPNLDVTAILAKESPQQIQCADSETTQADVV